MYKFTEYCIIQYLLQMDICYRKISSILTFNCCSTFQHFLFDETIINLFADLLILFPLIFKIFTKIKICLRQLFVILTIH